MVHLPVLKKEVLEYLDPKPNQNFIDCTLGAGGHTIAILEKNQPNGKVLGIELDPVLYQKIKEEITSDRLITVNDNFKNITEIIQKIEFKKVAGVLLDLGMSSWHIDNSGRGFSFQKEEELDMRYNPDIESSKSTAASIVNERSQEEIEKILKEYGEERFARRIAKTIVEKRKYRTIKTTNQLIDIIQEAVPLWYKKKRIFFATRTFQAFRIAANDELNSLQIVLPQIINILEPGGKIIVISFHSLEDRIVKNFFREEKRKNTLKIITKKPIEATPGEIEVNPRSRSAKLRVAEKLRE
ncbi:16S rRNA (cytosine(1402)-N(4))-methyltransferase RsmH [Patescibacteria group bacterium]|nr:16S rRNA (cytosine(1402)-N(4))-methyltransferase RsmH [Patescibacteria group bacterium]